MEDLSFLSVAWIERYRNTTVEQRTPLDYRGNIVVEDRCLGFKCSEFFLLVGWRGVFEVCVGGCWGAWVWVGECEWVFVGW